MIRSTYRFRKQTGDIKHFELLVACALCGCHGRGVCDDDLVDAVAFFELLEAVVAEETCGDV